MSVGSFGPFEAGDAEAIAAPPVPPEKNTQELTILSATRTRFCNQSQITWTTGGFVMDVRSCGPFENGDMEAAESAFDALAAEHESLHVEIRLLKREVRCLLDTIKCASEVLEKLTEEGK